MARIFMILPPSHSGTPPILGGELGCHIVCGGWSVDNEADEGGEEDEGDGGLESGEWRAESGEPFSWQDGEGEDDGEDEEIEN